MRKQIKLLLDEFKIVFRGFISDIIITFGFIAYTP